MVQNQPSFNMNDAKMNLKAPCNQTLQPNENYDLNKTNSPLSQSNLLANINENLTYLKTCFSITKLIPAIVTIRSI